MPVKSMHRRDDRATPCNFTLRASHIRLLDALARVLADAEVHVSRSRLVQYAVEQLRHDPRIERLVGPDAPVDHLDPLETV